MPFVITRTYVSRQGVEEVQDEVSAERLNLGRGTGSDVHLDDPRVGHNHARIEHVGSDYVLEALDNTSRTYVNNRAISLESLSDGDTIQIGPFTLRVGRASAEAPLALRVEQEAEEAVEPVASETVAPVSAVQYISTYYTLSTSRFTKWRLTVIGLVVVIGAMIAALSLYKIPIGERFQGISQSARAMWAPGEVTEAHRYFVSDCDRCHANPGQDIADKTCETCHTGPLHHEAQTFTPACVACHTEHKKRSELAAVNDQLCVQCHANLRTKHGEPPVFAAAIESFTAGHPEFAVAVSDGDPSATQRVRLQDQAHLQDGAQIKLNHKIHLKPDKLGPDRLRQLVCADCHELDAQGAYLVPISYEAHCQECHSLDFDDRFPRRAVPHDTSEVVREFLQSTFTNYCLDRFMVRESTASRESLRRRPGQRPLTRDDAQSVAQCRQEEVRKAEQFLFTQKTCKACHVLQSPEGDGELYQIAPPAIPQRWLPHSVFNHQEHTAAELKCEKCHQDVSKSKHTQDVLLPNIASCQTCHSGAGGARYTCVTCHVYHDKTMPHAREQLSRLPR